ncbi:MAG: division/cell wall cluster transcriptional repressor MraZ [Oscillospiraceae bacterium]|nr:division/cell wall cluster transcriptional repressor MraZ [Oscillospiraceae bacterium]
MLIGEYQHSLDAKGRISFPSKLREALGASFVVTKGLDNCLFVYRLEDWKILEEKTAQLPTSKARQIQRFLFAGAALVEPDKQGRVLLPQKLREHANLGDDVTVIGVSTRVEIWDTERWNALNEELTSESIADAMDELGF